MAMIPVEVTLGDFATTIQVDEVEAKRLGLVAAAEPAEPKAKAAANKARTAPTK